MQVKILSVCRPVNLAGSAGGCLVSPLHRFLGCVFMRRQLQHIIKNEEFLTMIATGEPSVIAFRYVPIDSVI
jgi:mediator of RNA polymerase II transcription subunit 14